MSEYWKSTPKYFCKQCKIYIRDTPFERSQHEASPKHQGSLKRFLRDLHRDNERQERDSQRAKNEVERLKQAVAGGASSKDGGGGGAASLSSSAHPPWKKTTSAASAAAAAASSRPVSVEERKRQIAQLAEMGVAIPNEYRGELALAGEWQTLSEKVIESADGEGGHVRSAAAMDVRKRKREQGLGDDGEDDEGQSDTERFVSKGWGSRVRQYPGVQDDGDADLDALLASTEDTKKAKPLDVRAEANDTVEASTRVVSTELPVKREASPESRPVDARQVEEAAGEEATPGIVFKKRKPKIIRK